MENTQNQVQNRRLIILNALPLNIFPRAPIRLRIVPIDDLRTIATIATNAQIVHFVRHPATLNLLRTLIPSLSEPNAGIYRYQDGDLLIIIVLRTPQRGQELQNVTLTDLEAWLVEVEVLPH
jgi:hypothetical protein